MSQITSLTSLKNSLKRSFSFFLSDSQRHWKQNWLQSWLLGSALAFAATFLGQVRVDVPFLLMIMLLSLVCGAVPTLLKILQVLSLLLFTVVLFCICTPVLREPLQQLSAYEKPISADAIVILGGGLHCGSQELEGASLARMQKGLELSRMGYASTITLSEQSNLLDAASCARMNVLHERHINALFPTQTQRPAIFTLKNVTTTRDEAARVRDIAAKQHWKRILLVTSPSHSARAKRLFEQHTDLQVISVPASEGRYDFELLRPIDRLWGVYILLYEHISRLKATLGGTPER